MDSQQGPVVWHAELCSMFYGSLDGRGVWGRMATCMCKAESLCYAPEIITALLIGSSPIYKFFFESLSPPALPGILAGQALGFQAHRTVGQGSGGPLSPEH